MEKRQQNKQQNKGKKKKKKKKTQARGGWQRVWGGRRSGRWRVWRGGSCVRTRWAERLFMLRRSLETPTRSSSCCRFFFLKNRKRRSPLGGDADALALLHVRCDALAQDCRRMCVCVCVCCVVCVCVCVCVCVHTQR